MVKDFIINVNGTSVTFKVYDCVYIYCATDLDTSVLVDCVLESANKGYNYQISGDGDIALVGATLPRGGMRLCDGIVAQGVIQYNDDGTVNKNDTVKTICEIVDQIIGMDELFTQYVLNGTVCIWQYNEDSMVD